MMKTNTTASRHGDNIERAEYLGFDAANYDAIRGPAPNDGTASFLYSSISPTGTSRVRVHVNLNSPTHVFATNEIGELAYWLREGEKKEAGLSVHYLIEPFLKAGHEETFPKTDPETSLSGLIDRFRNHPKIDFAKRIAARLDYLLEVSREEQPEQAPPAAGSLNGFLAFLAKNPGLAYPDIVLTFNGNLRAEWTRGPSEHFAIEFCEDENVRFVIFAPDPEHPYKTSRVSGTATIDSVMGLAEYYRVSCWVSAERMQAA